MKYLFVLVMLFSSAAHAATLPAATLQLFVSTTGQDSQDGRTVATAYASLTRAIQELAGLDGNGNTCLAQIWIAPGEYRTDLLYINFTHLSGLEIHGDIAQTYFNLGNGPVTIMNNNSNAQTSIFRIENSRSPLQLVDLQLANRSGDKLLSLIAVEGSQNVSLQACSLAYQVLAASSNLQQVLFLHQSQNLAIRNCTLTYHDPGGIRPGITTRVLNAVGCTNLNVSNSQLGMNYLIPTAGVARQVITYVSQNQNLIFSHCQWYSAVSGTLTCGVEIAPDNTQVLVDACGVSQAAVGIWLDRNFQTTLQNSWLDQNQIGLQVDDSRHCQITNNFFGNNSKYGLQIKAASADTYVFNNVFVNNGGNGGAQLQVTLLPAAISEVHWQSGYNLIVPGLNQPVAHHLAAGFTIPVVYANLKTWMIASGQDLWGGSLSYPTPMSSVIVWQPDVGARNWGQGTLSFVGRNAPTQDINGQTRPYPGDTIPDMGCVETSDPLVFHHIHFTPSQTTVLENQTISVIATFMDSHGNPVPNHLNYPLYFYLQSGDDPTAIEPMASFSSSDVSVQATMVAGLYRTASAGLPATQTSFRLNVVRSLIQGREGFFRLRAVEWQDWFSLDAQVYGGRTDDNSAQLRWLSSPTASQVLASSPVLASGRSMDYSLVRITPRRTDGTVLTQLTFADFLFSMAGPFLIDPASFEEDAFNPGTYQVHLSSSQSGRKTLSVGVLGNTLNAQAQIDFQTGFYGQIQEQATFRPIAGVRIELRDANGKKVAETQSDLNGYYVLFITGAVGAVAVLCADDPGENYIHRELQVVVSLLAAQLQNVELTRNPPAIMKGYGFPTPAKTGEPITLAYELPRQGRCRLQIFDLRGQKLIDLVDAQQAAGSHQILWPGSNRYGKILAAGVYIAVLRLDQQTATWKLVIAP